MKQIGTLLLAFGIGSIVLNLIGYEFKLMMWVDTWGPGVGWAIRITMAVVGAVLWLLGWKAEKADKPKE